MDAAWARGHRLVRHGRCLRRRPSETFIGRWRAARAAERLLADDEGLQPRQRRPGDRGLAADADPAPLEASLERLGVERIDLYLAHEPDPETPIGATVAAFEQLRARGLIGAWGLSNVDAAELEAALRHGRPALVQNSYSLLERDDEESVLPLCREQGSPTCPSGRSRAAG